MHGNEMTAAGVVRRTTPINTGGKPDLLIGEVHGRITPRAQEIAALLNCAAPADTTTNLWGLRWSKLIIDAMRNGGPAATGMSGKERDNDDAVRWLTIRLGSQDIRKGRRTENRFHQRTGGTKGRRGIFVREAECNRKVGRAG